ncbi:Two-component sensor histidine kinase, contains HisKA and HATPase domains [Methylobacterium phyllostachyos]|uniref:histidine kinase n=1 Tax=Methylobacterium phyllostachyos TaxID=582672 RepID=A0A1G9U6Y1_9HYPH|nr:HWE histidine kinase domain-containing protein [Methylobacterium phyllostachyos]SDM55730.1 Two-component sensor histidine kinase, contains HisKA and HATPase domains [Methylobacterium phyllostachyos]
MSLTTRIVLLVLLALAPAIAIQGYNEHALRAARDEAVRADTTATARTVADDLAQVAEEVRRSLDLLARDPRILALDPPACTEYLRGAATDLPQLNLLALTRPDGTVVCNSVGSPTGAYSNAERAYHKLTLSLGRFAMGGYARGVATGKDSVHFARPLRDEDGAVVGLLVAALDLDWLSLHLQKDLRLPSTTLTVADQDKVIMIRRPDGPQWVGKPIPEERQRILASRGEGVRIDVGIDGRERILANATPRGAAAGAWITVGRDRDVAFADVDAATRRGITMIALGAVLAIAAALLAGRFFIRRPFVRLLRASAAWREGDLSVRIGMTRDDEFGRLGRELDGMAGALQRNEAELRGEIARGREMQERQVTLLHELNHRVKNTLATVQALARQANRGGEAPGERLEARILALSKTHDLLTRDDWSGASLREVLEGEIGPYRDGPDRFAVDGPDVDLPARHVLSLGMTLHELVTNAAKHGALSVPSGTVRVSWRVTVGESGARRLCLDWVEAGGPPTAEPARRGFGSRLIRANVERELAGRIEVDFASDGLRCWLDVPLAAQPAMLAPHSGSG